MKDYRRTIAAGVGTLCLVGGLLATKEYRLRRAWRHEGWEALRQGAASEGLQYLAYSAKEEDIPFIVSYLYDNDAYVRFLAAFALTLRSGHNIPVPPDLVGGTVSDSPTSLVMFDLSNEALVDGYVAEWREWARRRGD